MIILGIDPGMAATGYGVISSSEKKSATLNPIHIAHGVITTSSEMGVGKRLINLRLNLRKIIREFKPDCMVVERHFFGKNSKTAMMVGQARGVIIMTAEEFKIDLFEYQGLAVKKLLTNDGRAEKMKIQKTVKKILRLKKHPTPDDAADALAIAVFHLLNLNNASKT